MDSTAILEAVYEIQGLSDPNDSPETQLERLQRIYELASTVMRKTGYEPSDPSP